MFKRFNGKIIFEGKQGWASFPVKLKKAAAQEMLYEEFWK